MTRQPGPSLTRRSFLRLTLGVPASLALVACGGGALGGASRSAAEAGAIRQLALTPACDGAPQTTPPQTEGPFFTASSPERLSLLESGVGGTRLVVTGSVLTTACEPVAGALMDFWQADDRGAYDNVGYTLRGHQYSDENGRYELETIVPGLYPGRTRHIHVKVQAPNGPVLTTQLYFPDEPRNRTDGIFNAALVIRARDVDHGRWGAYDFVVNVGPG